MFSWFNKWFAKKCKQALEESRSIEAESGNYAIKAARLSTSRTLEQNGINFTLYKANGGHILEYSKYDPNMDRHDRSLHIIGSDKDLGQGIAHIITFEMLKS